MLSVFCHWKIWQIYSTIGHERSCCFFLLSLAKNSFKLSMIENLSNQFCRVLSDCNNCLEGFFGVKIKGWKLNNCIDHIRHSTKICHFWITNNLHHWFQEKMRSNNKIFHKTHKWSKIHWSKEIRVILQISTWRSTKTEIKMSR